MPRKTDDTKNAVMSFSLPAGAHALLKELVDLQLVGGGQSEVIRHLVVTGLVNYAERGHIGRTKKTLDRQVPAPSGTPAETPPKKPP